MIAQKTTVELHLSKEMVLNAFAPDLTRNHGEGHTLQRRIKNGIRSGYWDGSVRTIKDYQKNALTSSYGDDEWETH